MKIEKLNSTGLSSAEVPAVYFNENNNNNNAFYPRSIKLLCPAKSYSANLGRIKIINKGVIKLHVQKKGKEKKSNNTQKEKPLTKTQAEGFVIRKKKTKITMEVYTTYQVNFLKYSIT